MLSNVNLDASSVEEHNCCFCAKPQRNASEEAGKQMLIVETTDGEALSFHYHEACFQEWLGNREHVVQASSLPKEPFVRW
jgi:hypothetical protein